MMKIDLPKNVTLQEMKFYGIRNWYPPIFLPERIPDLSEHYRHVKLAVDRLRVLNKHRKGETK